MSDDYVRGLVTVGFLSMTVFTFSLVYVGEYELSIIGALLMVAFVFIVTSN